MADNTQLNTGTGGDIISTDVITTLNGSAVGTGEKAQRVKVGFGSDATIRDVDSTHPLPVDGSSVTQPISGTVTVSQGTASSLKAQVSQIASVSTSATLQSAVSATGNGSTLSVDGMSSVIFTVSGTFVATVNFEGTEDGTNYASLNTVQLGTSTLGTSATAAGLFQAAVAGLQNVRARVTWTSGTSVTVTAHAVPVTYDHKAVNANIQGTVPVSGTFWQATQPVSGTLTANAGTNLNTSALALETGGNLATIASAVSAPGSVFNGKTTVTTAGTRVTLAASQAVKSVTVKALAANTGTIYVGNGSVASTNGFQLAAGDTISLDISNLNTVNLDSSVNGEGVTYLGVN